MGSVQSVMRALDLLERAATQGESGVTELAEAVGLHVATAHNLLKTLALRGYLVNADGRYRLGPSAGQLATAWDPLATLPLLAGPAMEHMSRTTGETGSLGVLAGPICRLVRLSLGSDEIVATLEASTFDDPLAIASGRLLVACSGREELLRQSVDHHLQRRGHGSREAWQRELAAVAREGLAVVRRHHPGSTDAIAVGLPGIDGHLVAALGAHCPSFRSTAQHLGKMALALRDAASETAGRMGVQSASTPDAALHRAVRRQYREQDMTPQHRSQERA